jgi:hypothetical protein
VVGVKRSSNQLNNEFLSGQIPNLDAFFSSENEPILGGGKEYAVDGAVNFGLS